MFYWSCLMTTRGDDLVDTHTKKKKKARQQDALLSSATSVGANWTFLKKTRQQGHLVAVWRQADIRALRFQWYDSSSERHSWRFNDQIKGATWHFNICELLTVKKTQPSLKRLPQLLFLYILSHSSGGKSLAFYSTKHHFDFFS